MSGTQAIEGIRMYGVIGTLHLAPSASGLLCIRVCEEVITVMVETGPAGLDILLAPFVARW